MPEARSFGRRGAAPASPLQRPAWDPPPVVPERGQGSGDTTDRLSQNASRFRRAGELLGFGGMLVTLLVSVWRVLDNHAIGFGKIDIPAVLSGAIDFASPEAVRTTEYMLPMVGSIAWVLIFVIGMTSAIRARWLLAGLCAATLAVPWGMIGVLLPMSPIMLTLIGGTAALRLYRPRGMKLLVTIILALVIGPGVVTYTAYTLDQVLNPGSLANARYLVVNVADLKKNEGLASSYIDTHGKSQKRVSTLEGLIAKTAEERGAKAFAVAQERTMRDDVAGTASALRDLSASGFTPNGFERNRIKVMQNFVASHGGYGEQAKAAFDSSTNLQEVLGSAIWYVGLVLGLLGPFADVIAGRITRRSKRIDAAQAELAAQRANAAPVAARQGFGRIDRGAAIQSIAALDGETVLKNITRRMRIYGRSAAWLGLGCVLVLGAGLMMWLPPAESNTAFSTIGVLDGSYAWVRSVGLPVSYGLPPLDAIVTQFFFPVLLLVGGSFLLFRRYAVYVAGAAVALLVFWQVASFFFVDHAQYEVPASSFTPELRARFEKAESMTLGDRAYVLAELAYVENRPDDIAPLLETVATDRRAIDNLAHEQRYDIMRDWAEANGHKVVGNIKGYHMIAPMNVSRVAAVPAMALGTLLGLAAVTAMGLFPVAARRRERIGRLVEQVKYRQEEYRDGVAL